MQEQQMLLAELSTHPRHPHVLPWLSLSPLPPSTHPLAAHHPLTHVPVEAKYCVAHKTNLKWHL